MVSTKSGHRAPPTQTAKPTGRNTKSNEQGFRCCRAFFKRACAQDAGTSASLRGRKPHSTDAGDFGQLEALKQGSGPREAFNTHAARGTSPSKPQPQDKLALDPPAPVNQRRAAALLNLSPSTKPENALSPKSPASNRKPEPKLSGAH